MAIAAKFTPEEFKSPHDDQAVLDLHLLALVPPLSDSEIKRKLEIQYKS